MLFVTTLLLFAATDGAVQIAQVPPAAAKPKLICKRTLDTGSLVKGKRVCLTQRQWQVVSDDAQAMGRRLVGEGTNRLGTN